MFGDFRCSPAGGGWNFDQSGGFGWWGGGGRGGGRRRGRVFEPGDLKLVILRLLAEKPRHGYEIIKALEERTGGAYSASPGVIYPTLTLLEDLGHARAAAAGDSGRRVYEITQAGRDYLEEHRATVDEIFQRMSDQWTPGPDNPMLSLGSAFGGLTRAAFAAVTRAGTNEARIRQIREIIEEATRSIDKLDR